ncbi:unnamed protein product [Heterobilharzia americana]|nr:unnamed protein product [Heterobilharzia americana]
MMRMRLGLAHSLDRYKLKCNPDKIDTMIVQAVGLMDELDKEINNYIMRAKEMYGWHFPELSKIVLDNITYVKVVKRIGHRVNSNVDLSDLVPEEVASEIREASIVSLGTEVIDEDITMINELCDQVLEASTSRAQLHDYLVKRMVAVAPNLTALVGELLGARLIARAGTLVNLAKHPASTVQILGAEKALFRALKTRHNTPKYGLLYHASLVTQSDVQFKGKMSRMLAAKTSLSARLDALGEEGADTEMGIRARAYLENRLRQLEAGTVNKQECLENFIITEHPIYYRCFTLRVRPTPPVPAGPTNGIRLILYRGLVNVYPLLMVVEEEPSIIQSSDTDKTAYLKDGYFIAFHEANTFPVFPVQSLPNGLSIRFGDTMRISLEQTYHEAVNLVGRVCVDEGKAPSIELVKFDKLSRSNSHPGEDLTRFKYTRQACIAILRQKLTYETCKCFTESYSIPYSMRDIGQTWCHDIMDSTTKMIQVWNTLKCVEKVANLSDHQILERIQPSVLGDGIKDCPLRCKRRLNNIHSIIRTKTVQNINPKSLIPYLEMLQLNTFNDSYVKADSSILKAEDLIFIDIHPVSEMINQIIEAPGYYLARFISDLGGISGLYVGVTFYTIAEVIDLITQYLYLYIPYFYRVIRLQMLKEKNMTKKIKRRLQLAIHEKAIHDSGNNQNAVDSCVEIKRFYEGD